MPGPVLRGKVGDTFEITLVNDGKAGLRVVKILEAADKSLKGRGTPVSV